MPVNVTSALQQALRQLEGEKTKIERQIQAVRSALDGVGSRRGAVAGRPGRRRRGGMSPEARRAASQRMKAYWAKRRGAASGAKSKKQEK